MMIAALWINYYEIMFAERATVTPGIMQKNRGIAITEAPIGRAASRGYSSAQSLQRFADVWSLRTGVESGGRIRNSL